MNQEIREGSDVNDAVQLQHAFDQSFALPQSLESADIEDLLTIRVAGVPHAIRLPDIVEIVTGRIVVSVPASTPDLLGLAGIHGGIVPVFGLSSLLGYSPDSDSPKWMILCGAEDPVALAFSVFDGYLQLPRSAFHAATNLSAKRENLKYVSDVVSTPNDTRAVISIPLIMATLRNRISHHRPTKELSK